MIDSEIFRRLRPRGILATHKELARKLAELEARIERHDGHTTALFEATRQLMEPPEKQRKRIGFSIGTKA